MFTTPPVTTGNTSPMGVKQKRNFKEEANRIQGMINRYNTDAFLLERSLDNKKLQKAHETCAEFVELYMLSKIVELSDNVKNSINPFITKKNRSRNKRNF